jgi:5-methylcytosine-specific restriction endonuclease McrA
MTEKQKRQLVYNKYGGKCAYCGCDLNGKFHKDHFEPIRRNIGKSGSMNPEREVIENYMPACASCNINKHSMSLEEFRRLIQGFMKHLNEVNTQYKVAKRYGLFTENIKPVEFYFEKYEKDNDN